MDIYKTYDNIVTYCNDKIDRYAGLIVQESIDEIHDHAADFNDVPDLVTFGHKVVTRLGRAHATIVHSHNIKALLANVLTISAIAITLFFALGTIGGASTIIFGGLALFGRCILVDCMNRSLYAKLGTLQEKLQSFAEYLGVVDKIETSFLEHVFPKFRNEYGQLMTWDAFFKDFTPVGAIL